MEDDDIQTGGGEVLSIDQAATAYLKATAPEAPASQSETAADDTSDTTDDELEASDEGEGEEGEGEPDDEGQADDEDETEPETEGGRYVGHNGRVKLPDGTESTVADLIQGNLKERDYRQKTMTHAEDVKVFKAKESAVTQLETQLSEQRDQMVTLLRSIVPDAPDPNLATSDPYAYTQQKAQHEAWMSYIQNFDQQGVQARQKKDEDWTRSRQEKGNAELATFVEKVPALKDEKRFTAFVKDAIEHGSQYGFSAQELREAIGYDHRMAMTLRDAIQWRKLQASKANVAKKVEGRPPVQKGGKRLNPSETRARSTSDAMTKLGQTGRLDDAVAAFLATQNK